MTTGGFERKDAGLVGSWKGQHSTQLGHGSFRLRFECDCTALVPLALDLLV